jgi:hypothetical protein
LLMAQAGTNAVKTRPTVICTKDKVTYRQTFPPKYNL